MGLSYERRVAHIDADIRDGRMGCPFAADAARDGRILYAEYPTSGSKTDFSATLDAYLAERGKVLMLLPEDDDRDTFRKGENTAYKTFVSLMLACRASMLRFLDRLEGDVPPERFLNVIDQSLRIQQVENAERVRTLFALMRQGPAKASDLRSALKTMVPLLSEEPQDICLQMKRRSEKLRVCRVLSQHHLVGLSEGEEGIRMDTHFAFVHAPYYVWPDGRKHPRFGRHYCMAVNPVGDIARAMEEDRAKSAATAAWIRASTGRHYSQGLHVERGPEPPALPVREVNPS